MSADYEKILETYWQKGGTYVIPTGIVNDLLGELEEYSKLQDRINKILKLIKDKVKDEYSIVDTSVVWEIESILKGDSDD